MDSSCPGCTPPLPANRKEGSNNSMSQNWNRWAKKWMDSVTSSNLYNSYTFL